MSVGLLGCKVAGELKRDALHTVYAAYWVAAYFQQVRMGIAYWKGRCDCWWVLRIAQGQGFREVVCVLSMRIAYCVSGLRLVWWAGLRTAYCVCVLRIGRIGRVRRSTYCVLRMRIAYSIRLVGWAAYCVLRMRIAYPQYRPR